MRGQQGTKAGECGRVEFLLGRRLGLLFVFKELSRCDAKLGEALPNVEINKKLVRTSSPTPEETREKIRPKEGRGVRRRHK